MKKMEIIGLVAGIMALAVGVPATYAWFTSVSEPVGLQVDTAKIAIAQSRIKEDITNKLPGETFGYVEWPFTNESSRESVVRFSIKAATIQDKEENDLERSEFLLDLLNDPENITISGISSGRNKVYTDDLTGDKYIWLESRDQLDDNEFSITMTVPKELGGNILDELTLIRGDNLLDEQEAVITLECTAHAVQGTYAAVADLFGEDVADEFLRLYHQD